MTDTSLKYVLQFQKQDGFTPDPFLRHCKGLPYKGATSPSASATFEFSAEPEDDLVARVRDALGDEWMNTRSGWTAATPLPMTSILPEHAKSHLLEAETMLKEAGVKGAEWVTEAPTGWSRIIFIFASMVADLAERAPSGSQLRLDCVKEKFGQLRIYTGQTGLPEDLSEEFSNLAIWAETQSHDRCLSTGLPGENALSQHWLCTLSSEARELREKDQDAFSRQSWPLSAAPADA